MNKLNFYHKFIVTAMCVIMASCAQQLSPGGGPSDQKAPELIKAEPAINSINFNSNEIELRFNEFITLKELSKYLLISPPTKTQPEVIASGKKIKIKLKDTLLPNTTYQLYLGNAIADIHESNELQNFSYIFSTGPIIDSLKIKGRVYNANDLSEAEGVNIQVYATGTDSIALKGLPKYISKTNKKGEYVVEGMAAGNYHVIALNDKNNNYIFENVGDKIGFLENTIEVKPDTSQTHTPVKDVLIFEEIPSKQFIKKTNNSTYGKIEFIFNKPMENPEVIYDYPMLSEKWLYQYFSKNNDTLTLWYNQTFKDSLALRINTKDYKDTIQVNLAKKQDKPSKGRGGFDAKLALEIKGFNNGEVLPNQNIILKSLTPIANNTTQKILVKSKTDSVWYTFKKLNETEFEITNLKTKDNNQYQLLILPGTFTNILDNTNDSIKLNFKTPEINSLGSLKITKDPSLEDKNLIIEVLNSKGYKVSQKYFNTKETTIEYLLPDIYTLKIVLDDDSNGKWSTGNFKQNIQPEKIFFIKNQSVKKRFETEVLVKE